jgi:glycosyltransferase involved in cell wall biosynthesis
MKVALDATPLTVATGGVRRYVAELSRALATNFPADEFRLVSDQEFTLPAELPNLRAGRGPGSVIERKWWVWGLQRELSRLGTEVFHGTDFAVPYLPLRPSVMTLHDLSPWRHPEWQPDAGRVRGRTPVLLRLGLATMIITPTEVVRRAAIEEFRLQPERVIAIPLAPAPSFHPVDVDPRRPRYFLFVGTLEPRKNLGVILEAWRELRQREPVDLMIAGRKRDDFEALPEEPGLHQLGAVEEEALAPMYAGAIACLYPSFYEGFGLPVLEAMQCGAAVITSKDPAITEVAAGAAMQVDARDTRGWVQAMAAVLDNGVNETWRANAIEHAANFTWRRTAIETREVYDEAAHRFRR